MRNSSEESCCVAPLLLLLFISFPPFCATELAAEFNVSDRMIPQASASTRVAALDLEVIAEVISSQSPASCVIDDALPPTV